MASGVSEEAARQAGFCWFSIALKPGAELSPEELISFCEERMAYFMVPRYVEFRDSLPKNPSQRIEKYKLRAEGNGASTWDREKAGVKLAT